MLNATFTYTVSVNQRSTRRQSLTWGKSLTIFKHYNIMIAKGLTMIYKTPHTHKKKNKKSKRISHQWRNDMVNCNAVNQVVVATWTLSKWSNVILNSPRLDWDSNVKTLSLMYLITRRSWSYTTTVYIFSEINAVYTTVMVNFKSVMDDLNMSNHKCFYTLHSNLIKCKTIKFGQKLN